MESIVVAIVGCVLALLAVVFCLPRGKRSTSTTTDAPKNPANEAARSTVQRTFEEEVGAISDALKEKSPAEALAAMGNKRKRT